MSTARTRTVSLGLVAVLVACGLAVVPAAAAGPPGTTALTAAQAKSALKSVVRATDARGLREGMRQVITSTRTADNRGYVDWTDKVTVDPRRGTVALATDVRKGSGAGSSSDPCSPGFADQDRKHFRAVHRQGVGSWSRLGPTANERAGLKLLDRSKRIIWAKRSKPSTSSAALVRSTGLHERFDAEFFDAVRFTSGSVTARAGGSRYVLRYLVTGWEDVYEGDLDGTLILDVAADRSVVSATQVEESITYSDRLGVDRSRFTVAYGPQRVVVPRADRSIAKRTLDRGCRAAETRKYPAELAASSAWFLNDDQRNGYGKVTVRSIRKAVREDDEAAYVGGLDIRVVNIRYGVMIVGRNKLLKRPSVSTVFVRNGKAVAHKVR